MDYNHITKFLDKFKKILFEGQASYEVIASVITKHISSPIDIKMISIKGTTILIKSSPMLRNEILIHKRGILEDLVNLLPQCHFNDIR